MTAAELSLHCTDCKRDFSVTSASLQVPAKEKESIGPAKCSECGKQVAPAPMEVGCPKCWQPFWIVGPALGRVLDCPHCQAELALPPPEKWSQGGQERARFQWFVRSGDQVHAFNGLAALSDAIVTGKIQGGNPCQVHPFAPPRPLRELTDCYHELRSLYDPLGALTEKGGTIGGAGLTVAYLLAHLIGGISTLGANYLLIALFGILAVVATPTVIGLAVVYVIASAMKIPLVGAYVGVLLTGLIAVAVFFFGRFLGRGVARMIGGLSGVESRRQVSWERP